MDRTAVDAPQQPAWFAWLFDGVAVVLCALALALGITTTNDLDWPAEPDLLRDIAAAQSILDCNCLDDAFYRGERLWYNPLVPSLVAGVAAISALPVHIVETRAGAFLNVLAPSAFYIMCVLLLGRPAALLSLAAFLFFLGADPPELAATYSPWLIPANFVQAVFYSTIAAYACARARQTVSRYLLVGTLLGLTFLGHTAPALVLGLILLLELLTRRLGVRFFAIVVGVAAVMGSPILAIALGHYHGAILNARPTFWIHDALVADGPTFATLWRGHVGRLVMIPTALGAVALIADRSRRSSAPIVASWFVAVVVLLGYAYAWQLAFAAKRVWPSIVPGFHFYRALSACEALLFGAGLAWTVGLLIVHRKTAAIVVAGIALAGAWLAWPAFKNRPDFTISRAQSLEMFRGPDLPAMLAWFRTSATPTDVTLASSSLALSVIGPAGRKVVLVHSFFSNPYVDYDQREQDADRLWKMIRIDDCAAFAAASATYGVSLVAASHSEGWTHRPEPPCGLTRAFHGFDWSVYRVTR